MKTRVLTIIGIILAVGVSITLGANLLLENANQREIELNQRSHASDSISDPLCLTTITISDEKDSKGPIEKCIPLRHLNEVGCSSPILEHISRYTNTLDKEFDGILFREFIGLPEGISEEQYENCLEFLHERRTKPFDETSESGSYELDEVLCIGGRGYILNEKCERIGKYDPVTGLPIIENKEQYNRLDGDWDEQQKTCDSKHGENENLFHDKPLSYWQNLDEDSLVKYYQNFGKFHENFFGNLGLFLIKSHSEEKLSELGITPVSEMEIDWTGIRPSLPPRMGFDAKLNSTDGKSYLISGTIQGNEILDNFQIVEDDGRRIGWTPAFEYSRVQITGNTALQICSIMEIACTENPLWDAIHRHDKDFTFFHYDTYGAEPSVQTGEHYIQIDKDQICHSFEDMSSQQIPELECWEIKK